MLNNEFLDAEEPKEPKKPTKGDDPFEEKTPEDEEEQPKKGRSLPGMPPAGFTVLAGADGFDGFVQKLFGRGEGTSSDDNGKPISEEKVKELSEFFFPDWNDVPDKPAAFDRFRTLGEYYGEHDTECKNRKCPIHSKRHKSPTWVAPIRFREILLVYIEDDFQKFPAIKEATADFLQRWSVMLDAAVETDPRYRVFKWQYDTILMKNIIDRDAVKLPSL